VLDIDLKGHNIYWKWNMHSFKFLYEHIKTRRKNVGRKGNRWRYGNIYIYIYIYTVSLLLCPRSRQLLRYELMYAGILCDKAGVLRSAESINATFLIRNFAQNSTANPRRQEDHACCSPWLCLPASSTSTKAMIFPSWTGKTTSTKLLVMHV
jgi:hypothetical protein